MLLGIDLTVDYAFKYLFGRDVTVPILLDAVDAVIEPAPGHALETFTLLNPFNPKEALNDKLSILDIKARDQSGRQFNVEMQMLANRYYDKRVLYYWARLHGQELKEGQDYVDLRPTISISFLDHVMFPQAHGYHLRFLLLETAQHFPFSRDIEFHVLELPKFTKSATELESKLDVWLYFLRHAAKIDPEALPAALDRPLVRRACEELKMLSQTDQERERYESRRKAQLDYSTGLKVARLQGQDEGWQRGRQEGRQEGQAEGLARGEHIGRIHAYERLLHRLETPLADLAALSVEELARRAEELQRLLPP